MGDLIYADEVYAIQGAIYEVYKTLGSGFLDKTGENLDNIG